MRKGVFVTISGRDGIGKGTQAQILASKIPGSICHSFPSSEATVIQEYLKGNISLTQRELYYYHIKDKLDYNNIIQNELLADNSFVIADRYDIDGIVYATESGIDVEFTVSAACGLITPDLSIILYGPGHRENPRDIMEEDKEFQQRINDRFAHFHSPPNIFNFDRPIVKIDTTGLNIAQVAAEIEKSLWCGLGFSVNPKHRLLQTSTDQQYSPTVCEDSSTGC